MPTDGNGLNRWGNSGRKIGRDGGIRTHDPLTPSQVRYRAALHSVTTNAFILKGVEVQVLKSVKGTKCTRMHVMGLTQKRALRAWSHRGDKCTDGGHHDAETD